MNSTVDFTDSVSKCNKKLTGIEDPTELFKKCRKLLTHFLPVSVPEKADNTVTAQLLYVLRHMQRAAKASTPGQRNIEDMGKSVGTMLVIACSEYKQEVKVVIFNTIECLFAVLDFEELKKISPIFFPNLKYIGRMFEKGNQGLAMLSCLKMVLEYVCKFPSDQKAEQVRKLSTSLELPYLQLQKLNAEWGEPDIDQKCRQLLNQMPRIKFYLLAVFSACCRRNAIEFNPLAGRKYFIAEWNNSSMRLSFTCLTKDGPYDMDIPYDDVEEYRFIGYPNEEEYFVDITGASFDIRLDLVSALDFEVLRNFLSPIMGNKDRSLPEPSEMEIMHINLESSVSMINIMRPVDQAHKFASTVTAGTWRPSTVEYSMENDANATAKATERPAARGGSRPAPAAAAGATETEKLLSDSQLNLYGNEYIQLNGIVGVEQLAKKTGKQNAPMDGRKRPCVDPYELDQARYDEGVVPRIPAAEGKKPRRSKKATQPPAAKTVVTSTNAPSPPMVQAIAQLRRKNVSTPKRLSTPFANVASHFRSSRDVSPIYATDSDDSGSDASWNPQSWRRKKLTKPRKMKTVAAATTYRRKDVQTVSTVKVNQQGRRQSFTVRQSIDTTYNVQQQIKEPQGPPQQQPDSAILSESDVSFEEVEEIKRRLKNNEIFASESPNSTQPPPPPTPLPTAGGRKRKFCFDNDQRKVSNTTTTTTTTAVTPAVNPDGVSCSDTMVVIPLANLTFATDEEGSDNETNGADRKYSDVIENFVHPTVQKLDQTVDQHFAEAKGSMQTMLACTQAELDVIMEKYRTFIQQQDAANKTFIELKQMVLQFKRDRPSEADMEQKIKQARENDQQLRGKLLDGQARLEQQLKNAQLRDCDLKMQHFMAVIQGVMSRTRRSIMAE